MALAEAVEFLGGGCKRGSLDKHDHVVDGVLRRRVLRFPDEREFYVFEKYGILHLLAELVEGLVVAVAVSPARLPRATRRLRGASVRILRTSVLLSAMRGSTTRMLENAKSHGDASLVRFPNVL